MKRTIAILLLCLISVFSLVGCSSEVEKEMTNDKSMFVVVEEKSTWVIVYHKQTKVMYAVSDGSYNYGTFTLLVDENGKPLLWQGE